MIGFASSLSFFLAIICFVRVQIYDFRGKVNRVGGIHSFIQAIFSIVNGSHPYANNFLYSMQAKKYALSRLITIKGISFFYLLVILHH